MPTSTPPPDTPQMIGGFPTMFGIKPTFGPPFYTPEGVYIQRGVPSNINNSADPAINSPGVPMTVVSTFLNNKEWTGSIINADL
ncbi:MAG: hypothetical protein ABJB11_00320 [Ferruginibacter sp.]